MWHKQILEVPIAVWIAQTAAVSFAEGPPAARARLVAPGVVSTGQIDKCAALTPDGEQLYFTVLGDAASFVAVARRSGGNWTGPEIAPFSGQWHDLSCNLSADGRRLVMASERPLAGAEGSNIWCVDHEDGGWSEPRSAGPLVNTVSSEHHPSIADDGTLYFYRRGDQMRDDWDIFSAAWNGHGFESPRRLGAAVNTPLNEIDPWISPDGTMLLFGRIGGADCVGGSDLYVSHRTAHGEWAPAVNLGPLVNTGRWEFTPSISPDGATLFFSSNRRVGDLDRSAAGSDQSLAGLMARLEEEISSPGNGHSDIYWIEVDAVPAIRAPDRDLFLGNLRPGAGGTLFAPGVASTNDINGCTVCLDGGRVCLATSLVAGTSYSVLGPEGWSEAAPVPWQNARPMTDFTAGPDDRTLYFQSSRPTRPDDDRRDTNIWAVRWTGKGWSEPWLPEGFPNTDEYHESYPSVAADGTICFFTGSRPDSEIGDIYVSSVDATRRPKVLRLPEPINSRYHEVDPLLSPDGSMILFGSGRPGGSNVYDLYVTFRGEDGSWSHPFAVGDRLSFRPSPARMVFSPDGSQLFFPSVAPTSRHKGPEVDSPLADRYGETDIYWTPTAFLEKVRQQFAESECGADTIRVAYRQEGIKGAVAALRQLGGEHRSSFHLELSELMMLIGDMVADRSLADAEQLYLALLDLELEPAYQVAQGYALALLFNGQLEVGLARLESLWTLFGNRPSTTDIEPIAFQLLRLEGAEGQLAFLELTTRQFPGFAWGWYNLAEAQEQHGLIAAALVSARQSLRLDAHLEMAGKMVERLEQRAEDEAVVHLVGDYFGVEPPGLTPKVFVSELLADSVNTVFTPDLTEFFFVRDLDGNDTGDIHWVRRIGSQWTVPVAAPFNSESIDNDVAVSADGTEAYFRSWRRIDGLTAEQSRSTIWRSRKVDGSWSSPLPVRVGGAYLRAGYPAVSASGNLYFPRAQGEHRFGDLFVSANVDGSFAEPTPLGNDPENLFNEGDLCVASDESFVITACWDRPDPGAGGDSDLYITFRRSDGTWAPLVNLGPEINTELMENCPTISPDGRYLFFSRYDGVNSHAFWVSTDIIETVRSRSHVAQPSPAG